MGPLPVMERIAPRDEKDVRFSSARARSGGFTVLELLIVVAIVGILASIAIPTYINYQDRLLLQTFLSQVEADLRNAQQKAKTTGANYEVIFNPNLPTVYRIQQHDSGSVARLVAQKDLPPGFSIRSNSASNSTIIYYPSASEKETDGGTIRFRSARGTTATLTIAMITGRIQTGID